VKIDPLDGPTELKEKADFVEDTRDKFRKKREALARIIREARAEKDILKSGVDFRTDTRHFDEEARLGRIPRQDHGLSTTLQAPTGAGADTSHSQPTGAFSSAPPSNGNTQTTGPNTPAPGVTNTNPAPRSKDGSDSSGAPPPAVPSTPNTQPSPQGAGPAVSDKTVGSLQSSKPYDGPPSSKVLDPNALLNLRVETLEGGAVDLNTLEALASDLDKLDRFLEGRASEIRRRAQQLKSSEK
jgi:hypothetical protein